MSSPFPAWFDLHKDRVIRRSPTASIVYADLIAENPTILFEPCEIKAWTMAERIGTHRDRVKKALDLLIQRGYIREHGRGLHNVRIITLCIVRSCPIDEAAKAA